MIPLPLPGAMRITWNLLDSFVLRWWQHLFVRGLHEHCIAAEVFGSRRSLLTPRVHLCSPDPTMPFKQCTRRFLIRIAFDVKTNKAQEHTLIRSEIFILMWWTNKCTLLYHILFTYIFWPLLGQSQGALQEYR